MICRMTPSLKGERWRPAKNVSLSRWIMAELSGNLSEQDQQLAEAIAAYYQALEAGQPLTRSDFLARHPDLAADLAAFLDDKEAFERRAGTGRPIAGNQ